MNDSPEISPVMRELATYISGALAAPLPTAVIEKTKHHVLDSLSAMISGSLLVPGEKAISYARTQGGTAESTVIGSNIVTSATNAALANGMLGHSDETDDSHAKSHTHPGCGIISAALAMGEREHSSGTDFLRAVALGYDVGTRMTIALHAHDFRHVGHSTHSFGPVFGASAAAGALARLSYPQIRHVLSFTAQQASGVSCWMRDADHIEKAFDFGGMPARNGVAAATMVAHGFTGVDDVFSGERNFFDAYDESARIGVAPDREALVRDLGSTFEIMNTNIKRWTVGSPIQAALDGLLELMQLHAFDAYTVTQLTVRVSHQGANTVDNRDMPSINLQHLCALMLIDGTVTFESAHDLGRMNDPAVLDVRQRIHLFGDNEMSRVLPSRQAIIELALADGRRLEHRVHAVLGAAENPMTRVQVEEKCLPLITPVLGSERARRLCETVWDLEDISSIGNLRPLLQS